MTNAGATETTPTPHDAAQALATLGLHVLPITPGRKHPPIQGWQDAATTNPGTIDNWWNGLYRGHGIGIATGERSRIWVLDVDIADGKPGRQNLEQLQADHQPLPRTVTAETGTGGRHILFRWDPDRPVTNGHATPLPAGLDIRGQGGQIVAAPTIHPNGNPYRWLPGRDPWSCPIADAPDWLYDLIRAEPEPALGPEPIRANTLPAGGRPEKRVAAGPEDSPADMVRSAFDWHAVLTSDGWTIKSTKANETHWTRPGKDARDGSSAVLHEPDGPFVIFTETRPAGVDLVGRPAKSNVARSVSLFDYLAAYHYGGNRRALAQEIRQKLMTEPTPTKAPGRPTDETPAQAPTPSAALNLPEEFWSARPELEHIRYAAWSRLLSPDAVFAVVLARIAAATDPAICIPSIIGAPSALSCYSALTGPPGTGKSTSIGAAADLVPLTGYPSVAQGGQLGSGEGLVELYIKEREIKDDDGKKKVVRVHEMKGAFVTLDEGAALAELGQRKGSTVLSVLRSMWTGGAIGQSNASKDTTRTLRAGGYSLGFVIGIQPSLAGALLSDDAAGTPQRFLWARTTDPTIPDEPVKWPGRLDWTPPQRRGEFGADMAVDPTIAAEIRSAALARNRGEVVIDALDAHADLLRLKVAGLLAVLDGRQCISREDWGLAEIVVGTSVAVRTDVVDAVQWEAEERARAADRAAARRAMATAEAAALHQQNEHDRMLDNAARSVARRIWKDGGGTRRDAARAISSRARKVVDVDDVIELAVTLGWVLPPVDNYLSPGSVRPDV